ncbi:MAG: NAD-dependent epimerase/dehydratase family protein [Gemmatimonadaceae bacterium]
MTGASGFVGQWLCRALLRDGWEVTGVSLSAPRGPTLGEDERSAIRWIEHDLRNAQVASEVVSGSAPDAVFHLAGLSFVPASGHDPVAGFSTNVGAGVALLAAVRGARDQGALDPLVLIVGSAEQYGVHDPAEGALRETAWCRPNTWYAASKSAQEIMALAAFRADGIRVVCTRSFNQAGPGQVETFLLPSMVRRVKALHASVGGPRPPLELGNLHTTRDFLHVTDAVEAYVSLASRGVPGEVYNVCSGTGVTVEALAREVCARAGVDADIVSDPHLRRAVDVPWLVGDNTKLRSTTGWAPRRSRSDILDDLLHAASH